MIFEKDYWKNLKEDARWNANDDYNREKRACRVRTEDRENFVKEQYNMDNRDDKF